MKELTKYKLNKISKNLDTFFNIATDEQIKEEDGGVMAFIVGVAENPKYVRDVAISSLANMATSFVTSPDVAGRAIVGGVAGMVTSKLPGISKALGFLSGFAFAFVISLNRISINENRSVVAAIS
jgi:hypothetical protein